MLMLRRLSWRAPMRMMLPVCSMGGLAAISRTFASLPPQLDFTLPKICTWLPEPCVRWMLPEPVETESSTLPLTEKVALEGEGQRVTVDKDNTTIIDGAGTQKPSRADQAAPRPDRRNHFRLRREKLQERLAKLAGGVAVIKVGAATETEMKERSPRGRRFARHARRGRGRHRSGRRRSLLRAAKALASMKLEGDEQSA